MSPASILLAAALVTAPGAGLTLLILPAGQSSLALQLGLAVPFGFAWVAVCGLILALVHVLTLPSFLALYLTGTAALWVEALRRGRPRAHLRAWRTELRAHPRAYGIGLGVLAALAITRFTYSPVLNLADQTPLRYWADGLEIADAHRIPSATLQWGHLFPTTTSKVVLNAFSAAASLVLGRGPLEPMGALLVVGSIGLLLATFALARDLGLRHTAPVVVIALFANHVLGPRSMTDDLVNYRAETWGRLLMMGAIVLGVRAFRNRRIGEAMGAGVLFGLAAGTHLVPCVVGLAFLAAYALGVVWFEGGTQTVIRTGAVTLAMTAAVGAFVLVAPRGDIGFQGVGDTSVYQRLDAQLGLPADFDPTRFLALGDLDQPGRRGAFYESPGSTYHEYVRRVAGEERLRRPLLVLMPVAGAAALLLLLRWGSGPLRAMALASALTAVAILAVAFLFSYRFDVYVLAEFGPRRLFDYMALPAVLLGAGVFEVGLEKLAGHRAAVVAAVGVAVLAAFAVPRNLAPSAEERLLGTALGPLRWIESNVPCQGRVLADRRTLASFETLTRHAGTTEGMGPYLRPAVLATAIRSLFDARDFFDDPSAHQSYVRREGIAAVVVTSYEQILGGVGGPLKTASGGAAPIANAPFLRLAAQSATVKVYSVMGFDPAGAAPLPDLARLPGYRCGGR